MSRPGIVPSLSCALVAVACAAPGPISPGAAEAAACMVEALKSMPGVVDAQILTGQDYSGRMPFIIFTLRDSSGQHFHRVVELHGNGGNGYSIPLTEGITRPLLAAWQPCGVMAVETWSS